MTIRGALRIIGSILAASTLLITGGCKERDDGQESSLATYDRGVISEGDLDRFILELPPAQRITSREGDVQPFLKQSLDRLFERRVLMGGESSPSDADEKRFQLLFAVKSREQLAAAYLEGRGMPSSVDEKELRGYLAAHHDELATPERRELFNLLIAPRDASPLAMEAACRKADELRRRLENGGSFESLAKQYSASSTRVSGGFVGLVAKSSLRKDVAEVVFSLDAGKVSDVFQGRMGCQIFLVRTVYPATEPTTRSTAVKQGALREKRLSFMRSVVREIATGEKIAYPPSPLPDLKDGNQVVFRVGSETVTARQIGYPSVGGKKRQQLLRQEAANLILALAMKREHAKKARDILPRKEEELRYQLSSQRAFADYLKKLPPERLRQFYERNRRRFVTDVRVGLTLYSIEIGDDPYEATGKLKKLASALRKKNEKERAVAAFEKQAGARREVLPVAPLKSLGRQRKELARPLFGDLEPGRVVGPFRHGGRIYLFLVRSFEKARQRSFSEARSQVMAALVKERGDNLRAEWLADLKKRHRFKVNKTALDGFGKHLLSEVTGEAH